jgi:hypothetical protein
MPLLFDKAQLAIKQEAVAGTAIALTATDVIIPNGPVEFEVEPQITDREFMSASLSPRGSVIGAISATIRWKQYLRGSGTTVPIAPVVGSAESDYWVPFRGCGLDVVVSGTPVNEQAAWTPSSSIIVDETTGAYCTVGVYKDGKMYRIFGAQGNCKITCELGMPAMAEFEFKGVYEAPTDVALLVPTYSAIIEPVFLGATVSILSYTSGNIKTFTLDFGNEIVMRPNPNIASGYFAAQIVRRKPVGTIDPEEKLAATKNWWTEWTALTPGAITTGDFAGVNYNTFNINVPNATYRSVNLADREGILNAPIEFDCRANTAAGEDEFTITQT